MSVSYSRRVCSRAGLGADDAACAAALVVDDDTLARRSESWKAIMRRPRRSATRWEGDDEAHRLVG